jgi:hypothetical protein
MNQTEYRRLRAKIIADYHKDLESLDRVYKMMGGTPEASTPAPSDKREKRGTGRVKRGLVSGAIEEVLPEFVNDEFTSNDISSRIRGLHPDMELNESSLSSALVRLSEGDDSRIVLITPGKGRRPAVFRVRSKGVKSVAS